MTGTGPTAAVRNRLEATSAPNTERASFCRLIETDIVISFCRPADHPPVMQERLQRPCQMQKMAEFCRFLKTGLEAIASLPPSVGEMHQSAASAFAPLRPIPDRSVRF